MVHTSTTSEVAQSEAFSILVDETKDLSKNKNNKSQGLQLSSSFAVEQPTSNSLDDRHPLCLRVDLKTCF